MEVKAAYGCLVTTDGAYSYECAREREGERGKERERGREGKRGRNGENREGEREDFVRARADTIPSYSYSRPGQRP